MTPNQIQAAIKDADSSQVEIAEELGITDSVVNRVVHGSKTSARIAKHIADKLGQPVDALWPGRYGHSKDTTKSRPAPRRAA